jgi:hypothetical protein
MQRLSAALRQPAIKRARNGTNRVLEEGQALVQSGVMLGKNDGTHYDIGVTIDVFCKTVKYDIDSLK